MRPKLTIGMATHQDFDGAYFTLQSLRLHHPEAIDQCELLVVDQSPGSRDGQDLGTLCQRIGTRYIAMPEPGGTAAPRQRVFDEAAGEGVLCVDSHVLLVPGAVRRLIDFYDAGHDGGNLLQGPMLYDELSNWVTHMDPVWRSEMYGTWGVLWTCPCRQWDFTVHSGQVAEDRKVALYHAITAEWTMEFVTECPVCGRGLPAIDYNGHERALAAAGFARFAADPEQAPKEIPMHGLGLFSCRRSAWLEHGGFNPRFRGFGGEEGYIHAKFRAAGHATLCLPWLRWLHRFGRPGGVPYRLARLDKLRNHVLGWTELGLDVAPIREHFVDSGLVSPADYDLVLANIQSGEDWPVPAKHVRSIGGHVFQADAGCGDSQPAGTLAERFERARSTPSDINEHCDTLRRLASQCEHATEFGMRHGVSTVALLAGSLEGNLKKLVSYDAEPTCGIRSVGGLAPDVFEFRRGDSLSAEIDETDLLFVDTKHTASQLYTELTRHAERVRRWIVLHDTQIFGEKGEDGGPGLLPALRRFLKERPEWSVVEHHTNNHGLTVISRDPRDRPKLPSTVKMATNFAKALAAHVADGREKVERDVYEERLTVCTLCDQRAGNRCAACGCYLEQKAAWRSSQCPLGKWTV